MADLADYCDKCGAPFVSRGSTWSTLVGYQSDPGHQHDDNCRTSAFYCANGHVTKFSLRNSCPACDWRGRDDCFCHPGPKVDRWPTLNAEAS